MAIKRIIFDLDGTLVDTLGGIAYSCNYVLRKNGYPTHEITAYKDFVGHGLRQTIYNALPKDTQSALSSNDPLLEKYVDELHAYYEDNYLVNTKLYTDIEAMLDYLDANDISWGIHTNKKESIAQSIADTYFGDRKYVGLIGFRDDYPQKPDPKGTLKLLGTIKSDEALMVGDTEVDAETALNANIKPICVTWGFRSLATLEKLNTVLIDSPMELIQYLNKLTCSDR